VPLAAAFTVAVALRRFHERAQAGGGARPVAPAGASEWRPFACLIALCSVASGVSTGLLVYVPLFLIHARGTTAPASNVMTSILLGAAACGTVAGGMTAQRRGRRLVLIVPQLVLVPAIALLPSLGFVAMVPLIVLIGVCVNANISTTLVLAQEYLPRRMGLASGLTIGLCSGVGGLIVAALGVLGDAAGPSAVLYTIAALPLLVAAFAALLPKPAAAPPGTIWSMGIGAEG